MTALGSEMGWKGYTAPVVSTCQKVFCGRATVAVKIGVRGRFQIGEQTPLSTHRASELCDGCRSRDSVGVLASSEWFCEYGSVEDGAGDSSAGCRRHSGRTGASPTSVSVPPVSPALRGVCCSEGKCGMKGSQSTAGCHSVLCDTVTLLAAAALTCTCGGCVWVCLSAALCVCGGVRKPRFGTVTYSSAGSHTTPPRCCTHTHTHTPVTQRSTLCTTVTSTHHYTLTPFCLFPSPPCPSLPLPYDDCRPWFCACVRVSVCWDTAVPVP